MAHQFNLAADRRDDAGKGASRRLRRTGQVPGIIYGGGEPPVNVSLNANQLTRLMAEEAFFSSILNVTLDGKGQPAVVRAYQPHPSKRTILHIDLQRIVATEKIRMSVPFRFINAANSKGVKIGGGSVMHLLTEVEISCLPADLPEYIEVDVGPMELNDMLHLRDLTLPAGVELPNFEPNSDSDLPVVHVHVLRGSEEDTAAAGEEGGETAAPAAEKK